MPGALPSVPSFSEQQVHDLVNIIHSVIQQYLASQYSAPLASAPSAPAPSAPAPFAPTPSTPLASQAAQKEEDKQPLYQVTVESTTENTTKLSTIPRLCTARSSRDSAACLSILACQHPDYIGHSKGIEKTGQG